MFCLWRVYVFDKHRSKCSPWGNIALSFWLFLSIFQGRNVILSCVILSIAGNMLESNNLYFEGYGFESNTDHLLYPFWKPRAFQMFCCKIHLLEQKCEEYNDVYYLALVVSSVCLKSSPVSTGLERAQKWKSSVWSSMQHEITAEYDYDALKYSKN